MKMMTSLEVVVVMRIMRRMRRWWWWRRRTVAVNQCNDDGWALSFPVTLFLFVCTQINGIVGKTSEFISYSRPSNWNVSRGLYNVV